jgi:GNAT superfamily N-acetyltransferase
VPVRELLPGETALAHQVLCGLRPAFGELEAFVRHVDELQRPEGYRLAAALVDDEAVAAMGFRRGHNLAWGDHLYVDDLVTLPAHRGRGHARMLLDWVLEEARRLGCVQLHLDSGTQRHDAHRLYLGWGMTITSFHFAVPAAHA